MLEQMDLSIAPEMKQQIEEELNRISKEQNINILYACESGSRAWGFASPDSDYDVRIIYIHNLKHYLSILPKKDNLDYFLENDLDVNGWDLKKFLHLLLKSNATPFEWLQSPIVYSVDPDFKAAVWNLAQQYFQPRATMHHYLGLAQNAFRKGIVTEFEINIKKYFYVLRPLFAAMWIADRKTIAPMNFAELFPVLDPHPKIKEMVLELWQQKLNASEGDTVKLLPEIVDFIEQQAERCFEIADATEKTEHDVGALDAFFRSVLKRYR
jgi:predicted nucleotidyltransferase